MSTLRTAASSSLRIGTVGPAEVESSTDTLGSGMGFLMNADMAATWALVMFVGALIFLFFIL